MKPTPSYALPNHPSSNLPDTMDQLQQWIRDQINDSNLSSSPEARLYVARSIPFDPETQTLMQTGCSPNYFGGLWTLACCKHTMRSAETFRRHFDWHETQGDILEPSRPLFIGTFASTSNAEGQHLASLARVTKGFRTIEAYGRYLDEHYEGEALEHRLTAVYPEAKSHGDCHWDRKHTVSPPPGHPHHQESSCGNCENPHEDNSGNHVICLAEESAWLGWETPAFVSRTIRHQSAYGDVIRDEEDVSTFVRALSATVEEVDRGQTPD